MEPTLFHVFAGIVVGLAIGMTGVGGGSLMTPLLVFNGTPFGVAIGTDLMYAAITKAGAVYAHHRQKTIRWRISLLLCMGSIPASILTTWFLYRFISSPDFYQRLFAISLGIMLLITAIFLLLRPMLQNIEKWQKNRLSHSTTADEGKQSILTIAIGSIIGVLVTLSSVGAGVFGTMALFLFYPKIKAVEVVGTELAHAVPLTLIAGMGHWLLLDNLNLGLLTGLILGSLPAVWIGSQISARMPQEVLRHILIFILAGMGGYFILKNTIF